MNEELQKLQGEFLVEFKEGYKYQIPGQITIGDFATDEFKAEDNMLKGYNVTPFGSYNRVRKVLKIQMEESRIDWAQRGWSWCIGKVNKIRWYSKKSDHYVIVGWQLDLERPLENEMEFVGTYS